MTRKGCPEGYIGHHTLFEGKVMNGQKHSKKWRIHPGMRIIIPEKDEQYLHRELPSLPRPSKFLAGRALEHLAELPPTFSRLEMFDSVIKLMGVIADRSSSIPIRREAETFHTHFREQKVFFDRALTKEQEQEALLLQRLAMDLADSPESPNSPLV